MWKPAGYPSLSPYLVVRDAQQVIDFLVATVDAELLRSFPSPGGGIMHAELRIDDSVVMMGEGGDDHPLAPAHIHLYVPDVEATYQRALSNGGTSVQPPIRKEGEVDRRCGVGGPGGGTWWFATIEE